MRYVKYSMKNTHPQVFTNLNVTTVPITTLARQVDPSKHIKALTQPLIKSNFAEHIFNTHHTFTDIETNLEDRKSVV